MLLSVIVPVYNVENYLERCIDSILDQGDFTDYEIILVDDGSTDGSGQICDNYKNEHSNISVIHKENGGLSSARNAGMRAAQGKYVQFIDSDDYIKSNSIKQLVDKAEESNTDILTFNYAYKYEDGKVEENDIVPECEGVISGEDYLLNAFKSNTMQMGVWKNLYSKALLIDNNLFFREGFVHEDEEWTPRVFLAAKRVCSLDEVIYAYCIRKSSISRSNDRKAALDLLNNCERLKEYSSSISNQELKRYFENNIVTLALSAFYKGKLFDKKAEIIKTLLGLSFNNQNKRKYKLFSISPKFYFYVNYFVKTIKFLGG